MKGYSLEQLLYGKYTKSNWLAIEWLSSNKEKLREVKDSYKLIRKVQADLKQNNKEL